MSKRLPFEQLLREQLPNFETLGVCQEKRNLVLIADQWRVEQGIGPAYLPIRCEAGAACYSGLCPACVRQGRLRVLAVAKKRQLYEGKWLFVTVFIDGWTIPPGDHSRYSTLANNVGRLRRGIHAAGIREVLVIGAVETVYKVVANKPVGKPFHLHLLVRGLTEEQIRQILQSCLPLDRTVPRYIDVKAVGETEGEFLKALSYVFKQPFWKASKADQSDVRPRKQWPKKQELAELISNLGPHEPYSRLFNISTGFAAIRVRAGWFSDATGFGEIKRIQV